MKICYLHYSRKAKQIITINISKPIWTILKILGNRIKCIITIKNLSSDIPKSLSYNGSTITDQGKISNVFNNYSAVIAGKTKESISPSQQHFSDFLKNRHQNSCFLSPANKSEINIILHSIQINQLDQTACP